MSYEISLILHIQFVINFCWKFGQIFYPTEIRFGGSQQAGATKHKLILHFVRSDNLTSFAHLAKYDELVAEQWLLRDTFYSSHSAINVYYPNKAWVTLPIQLFNAPYPCIAAFQQQLVRKMQKQKQMKDKTLNQPLKCILGGQA